MVYTSRRRNFKQFIKTRNLKYYFAFLAMVLAVIAAVIVITKNNVQNKNPENNPSVTNVIEHTSEYETETDIAPETVRGVYRICVNLATCRLSVYEWNDDAGEYSANPKRSMIFAAKNVREGEYRAPYSYTDKKAWKESEQESRFYRYATVLGDNIIFHSADYGFLNDKNSLISQTYTAIGAQSASDENPNENPDKNTDENPDKDPDNVSLSDGITLILADAKWIYENCSYESEVMIYSDLNEKIFTAANDVIQIPDEITWEPTDNSNGSPWCQTEIAELVTPPQFELLALGVPLSYLLDMAKATDIKGNDVSRYVYLAGEYDLDKNGKYNLSYNIVDVFGNHLQKPFKLVVNGTQTAETDTNTDTNDKDNTTKDDETDNNPTHETGLTEPDTTDEHAQTDNGNNTDAETTDKTDDVPTDNVTESETTSDTVTETESNRETISDTAATSNGEDVTDGENVTDVENSTDGENVSDKETDPPDNETGGSNPNTGTTPGGEVSNIETTMHQDGGAVTDN